MKIFYFSVDNYAPCGGVKAIYRHVELLCQQGYEAYVVQNSRSFKINWFLHSCPVASRYRSISSRLSYLLPSKKLNKKSNLHNKVILPNGDIYTINKQTDYIVLPDIFGYQIDTFLPGYKKIIFNQGAYLTFHKFSENPSNFEGSYHHPDVRGCMVVSEDSEAYVSHVFPNVNLSIVPNTINANLFSYSPNKKPQIAFMPRKNSDHIHQIQCMLKFRNTLDDFKFIPINNISETRVSEILRDSLIFLSSGSSEGFGLPPAEAMSCGCIVTGYHANGGKEYFQTDFSYPREYSDILGVVQDIEAVIKTWKNTPKILIKKGKVASDYIKANYSEKIQVSALLAFWKPLLTC